MIRDRCDPMPLFALVPQWQLRFEPELAELDRLLADEGLFQEIKAGLAQRRPKSRVTGRPRPCRGGPAGAGDQASVGLEL